MFVRGIPHAHVFTEENCSQTGGRAAFVLWMYVIYMTFPGIYAILPAVCTEVFGTKDGALVIGIVVQGFVGRQIV